MNGKNKMIAWIAGTITVIILLAVLIVWMEPAKEGISRAEAYKALALVFADRQECERRGTAAEILVFGPGKG